jgi:tetratricopeptide (TPR) repeat protein
MQSSTWQQHEEILIRFESEWRVSEYPDVSTFAESCSDERTVLLLELIQVDMEFRWKRGTRTPVEHYLDRFPQLQTTELTQQLITAELQLRVRFKQDVDLADFLQRFPDHGTFVQSGLERTHAETAIREASIAEPVVSGSRIGRYVVDREIGSGTFAIVYRASDPKLNRQVAIKVLRPEFAGRRDSVTRMVRESQIIASLEHPAILPIFEVGDFDGRPFFVTTLIAGGSLAQALKDQDRVSPSDSTSIDNQRPLNAMETCVRIVAQVADAVAHSHQHGVVHRDIKPANILLDNRGRPLLTDFGLAHFEDADTSLTGQGDVLGTPAYMAPELATGHGFRADPRCDVYSLGAVLYRLICGRPTYEGSITSVLSQLAGTDVTAPRILNSVVSRDLQTVCLKCLEKDLSDRYQSADELGDDLRRCLQGVPVKARPVGLSGRLWRWSRRHTALATSLVLVIVLAAFLIGGGLQLNRVSHQRDLADQSRARAVDSESDTKTLLAEASATAGLLAMQRGQYQQAIDHFDQSLAGGYPDQVSVRLKKIQALIAARELDLADAEWKLIPTKHSRAAAGDGEILLWQAQLAMEGRPGYPDALAALHEAISAGLARDDEAWAQALLADHSLECVAHLRDALQLDAYHHRARRLLITMLLSLAELDEAAHNARTALELCPDDINFQLLDALTTAVAGQSDIAIKRIDGIDLPEPSLDALRQLSRLLTHVATSLTAEPGASESDRRVLASLGIRFVDEFLPLLNDRGVVFPPRIALQFADLPAHLQAVAGTAGDITGEQTRRVKKQLEETLLKIVDVHPEGALLTLLGDLQLSRNDLDSARSTFRRALEVRSFTRDADQHAWMGIFTAALVQARSQAVGQESNTRAYVDAASHLDPETVGTEKRVRAVVVGLLQANEIDTVMPFADYWVATYGNRDAVWHRAIVAQRQEDWLTVVRLCDRMLAENENDRDASNFRGAALRKIAALTEPAEDSTSGNDSAKSGGSK